MGSEFRCSNPSCQSPHAAPAGARGLCWNCYQSQRRSAMPKKRVSPCMNGRRYHSYAPNDKCKYCGAVRLFNI